MVKYNRSALNKSVITLDTPFMWSYYIALYRYICYIYSNSCLKIQKLCTFSLNFYPSATEPSELISQPNLHLKLASCILVRSWSTLHDLHTFWSNTFCGQCNPSDRSKSGIWRRIYACIGRKFCGLPWHSKPLIYKEKKKTQSERVSCQSRSRVGEPGVWGLGIIREGFMNQISHSKHAWSMVSCSFFERRFICIRKSWAGKKLLKPKGRASLKVPKSPNQLSTS